MKKAFALAMCLIMAAALPLSAALAAAGGASYVETVFNERNGLPTGEANDVIQTSDGYIWVGSYGGLIRYDGTNFRNFSTEGILPSSSVRMMFEDSAGRLWIGTNDAGVFFYENGEMKRPEGQPTDNFLCVRGFAEGADGVIYACSNSGACEIRDGKMTVYTDPEIAQYTVYSLAVDKYGCVWCADSSYSMKVLKEGKVLHAFSDEDIFGGEGSIYSVTGGIDGEVYVGSGSNSIAKITFSSDSLSDGCNIALISTGAVSVHNSMRMMKDGTLVISGQQGLGILNADGTLREFSASEDAESVNSAFVDYEGNVWAASSSKGTVRFSVGSYSTPNSAAGLDGMTINTITLSDGCAYLGAESELLIFDADWHRVENELTEIYHDKRIRDIITDSKGRVWIAADRNSDHTVVRYDPKSGEIKAFTKDDGLISDRARVLLELSDGRIAVGMHNSVSIISGDKVEKVYSDFEYPTILSLLETDDGALLAGSDGGGIYEIKGDSITNHGFSEGLKEGVVLRMMKDSEGAGRFISAGSSLYYWENNEFTKLTAIEKQPGSIFDFYQTGDTLWLLQNSGILASSREDILAGGTGRPVTYGFAHGLTGSLNANTWHCLADGKLYLATRSGISVFGFEEPEYILPKIIINSVNIDGQVIEHPEKLEIPNTAQRVTINFAALSFSDTVPISLAYRLTGFEDAEILLKAKSGTVSYTNLPGGTYSFDLRVIAGDKTSTLSLSSVKAKRLTEQPAFWIVITIVGIVAVAGIVALIASVRIRAVKKRQQEYRDILEQSLLTFAGTIDAKDKYTNGHSRRVAEYSRELAKRLNFTEEQQEHIYYVALLHDIGKIGIPDNILNKPGKLDSEERKIIETHPRIGAEILKNFTALEGISDGAKYHHERYDGTGYNEGIAGTDIPLIARVIGVADTYDAMSSERCYRKPLSKEKIISELQEGKGKQFDPEIVEIMLQMIEEDAVPFK